jgi:hypothetical protein
MNLVAVVFNGPILSLQSGVRVTFSSWLETNLISGNKSSDNPSAMEKIFTTNGVPRLKANSLAFCHEEVNSYKCLMDLFCHCNQESKSCSPHD